MALSAVTMLACAACGGGGDEGEESPQSPEAGSEQELKEQEDPGEQDGQTQAGTFDECGLLTPEELAGMIGVEQLHVTSRSAAPQSEGGRLASCGYNTDVKPGISQVALTTVAGTNSQDFFAPFAQREAGPVPNLGDEAQVVAYEAPEVGLHFRELRVLDGANGLHVWYSYSDAGTGVPELTEDAMAQLLSDVANAALERMPETVEIGDGAPEGQCADVDLEQAARVLGQELTMARSVLADDGAVNCAFAGDDATLSVTLVTDAAQVAGLTPPAELINEPGIGDGALVQIVPSEGGEEVAVPLDAAISVGDRLMMVRGAHGPDIGPLTAPRPEDTQLVRDVVTAFGY